MNLTDGQKHVLEQAGRFGASKGNLHSKYWRNCDQLERKGLIQRGTYTGFYHLTNAGTTLWDELFANQQRQD